MERLLKGTTVFAFNTKRQRSLGHREAHVLFDGMIDFRDVHGNVQQLPIPPDLKKEDLVDFLDSEQNQERIRNYIFHLNTTVTFTKSLCEHKQTTMVYPITDPIVRFPNKLQNIVTMFKGHWFDSSVVQIDPRTNTVKRFVSYTTNGSPPLTCSGDIDTTSGTRSHVYTIGGTGDFFICISGYEKKKLKDYADVRPNVMLVMNGEYHCIPVPLDAVRIGDASMCIVAMLRITDHDMLVVQPTVLWTCEGIEVGDCSNSFYQDRVLDTNPLLMRELNCTTTFPEKPREEAKEDTLLKVTKCSLFVEAGLALPTVFQGRTTHIGVIGRGFHVQREDETHTASAGVWFSPFQDVVRGPLHCSEDPVHMILYNVCPMSVCRFLSWAQTIRRTCHLLHNCRWILLLLLFRTNWTFAPFLHGTRDCTRVRCVLSLSTRGIVCDFILEHSVLDNITILVIPLIWGPFSNITTR